MRQFLRHYAFKITVKITRIAFKMAAGFGQRELFFELQMAAQYGGCHFRGTHLENVIQSSAAFGNSLSRLRDDSLNVARLCEGNVGLVTELSIEGIRNH